MRTIVLIFCSVIVTFAHAQFCQDYLDDIETSYQVANNQDVNFSKRKANFYATVRFNNDLRFKHISERNIAGVETTLEDFDYKTIDFINDIKFVTQINSTQSFCSFQSFRALSGSTVQSKIQPYPGDPDFFARIEFKTRNSDLAYKQFADIVHTTALQHLDKRNVQLVEVKFGIHKKKIITWSPEELIAEQKTIDDELIKFREIKSHSFVKIDYIVHLKTEEQSKIYNTSIVFDPIYGRFEEVISMDGEIHPIHQEVFFDIDQSTYSKLKDRYVKMRDEAIIKYVDAMCLELTSYASKGLWVKVAKRAYNHTTASWCWGNASYLQALFSDEVNKMYQYTTQLKAIKESMELKVHPRRSNSILREMYNDLKNYWPNGIEKDNGILRDLDEFDALRVDDWQARIILIESISSEMQDLVNEWYESRIKAHPYFALLLDSDSCNLESNNLKDELKKRNVSTVVLDGKEWTTENINLNTNTSLCYGNVASNCDSEGKLYTQEEAKTACLQMGSGWRLPSDEEWKSLMEKYSRSRARKRTSRPNEDMSQIAYNALIRSGSTGFNASFGGKRILISHRQIFYDLGVIGYYWSSSKSIKNRNEGMMYTFRSTDNYMLRESMPATNYASCRCVRQIEK